MRVLWEWKERQIKCGSYVRPRDWADGGTESQRAYWGCRIPDPSKYENSLFDLSLYKPGDGLHHGTIRAFRFH
jgi:hypothetical protein